MSDEDIMEMKKEMEHEKRNGFARWSWYAMWEKLAMGDITKFDHVGEQNYISSLNLLAYWADKDKEQAKIQKEMLNKSTIK